MPIPDRTEVIAHRGASAHAPENTLESFALALRLGADCLELDVRASADGVPVVLHDPTLDRTTGIAGAVARTTASQLGELPARSRPPTLDEVLDAFGTATSYLVEVKRIPVETESVLLDAFAMRGLEGNVTVQSFDHLLLRRLRHRDRDLRLAALFRPGADVPASLDLVAPFVDGIGPAAGHVDAALVSEARSRRLAVRPWTVNHFDEMERLLAAGVDGIITDRPERARAVVNRAVRATPPAVAPPASTSPSTPGPGTAWRPLRRRRRRPDPTRTRSRSRSPGGPGALGDEPGLVRPPSGRGRGRRYAVASGPASGRLTTPVPPQSGIGTTEAPVRRWNSRVAFLAPPKALLLKS